MVGRIGTVLIVSFVLGGWAITRPPIAKEADERSDIQFYERFAKYVPTIYPIGSDASKIERELRSQGFFIKNSANQFSAEDAVWYCDGGYFVKWSVDQERRIASISAEEHRCAGP